MESGRWLMHTPRARAWRCRIRPATRLAASILLCFAASQTASAADAPAVVTKLAAAARRDSLASAAKPQAAARAAISASALREVLVAKLAAHARRQTAAASGAKAPVADPTSLPRAQLLGKLRDRAASATRALGKPGGAVPRPVYRPAAVQQQVTAALVYGDSLSGTLVADFDQRLYSFTGAAGDLVDISLVSGDFDAYLELLFEGQSIAVDDDSGGDFDSLIDGFALPASGQYTIVARAFSTGTGSFVLRLDTSGNTTFFAGTIAPGSLTENLGLPGQVRLYHLVVDQTSQVVVGLSSTDFDAYLALYAGRSADDRADDNLLGFNDDSGGTLDSRLELILDAGDYLVEARAFSSSAEGTFTLSVDATALAADEDAGGPVALGPVSVTGGLFPAGDEDLFTFSGAAGDVVGIALDSDQFDPVLELELAGQVVAFDDDGGGNRNSLLADFVLPATGDYVVRVRSFGGSDSGVYSLSRSAAASPFTSFGLVGAGFHQATLPPGAIHLYAVEASQPALLRVDLESDDFDAFLVLYRGSGPADRSAEARLAVDDDGGEGFNSHLELSLPAGTYLVEARSYRSDASGAYGLAIELSDRGLDEDAGGTATLAVGTTVSGAVFPAGDRDAFHFSGQEGDVVEIGAVSEDFDPVLFVDLGDSTVAFDDDSGGDFDPLLSAFVLPVSGQYTIVVQAYHDAAVGAYTLRLGDVTPPLQLRAALVPGTVSGTIAEAGQADLYPLQLAAASQVQLDLASAEFDAFLSLYAGSGAGDRRRESLIASDDDGGVGLDSRLSLVLEAGTYLVEARPLSGTSLGAYQLSMAAASLAGDEDSAGPQALAVGADSVAAVLFPAGDEDRFQLSGAAGDIVDVAALSDSLDPFLELRFDGRLLGSDDDSGDDLDALLTGFVLPRSGNYEVLVRDAGGRGTGGYRLVYRDRTPAQVVVDTLVAGLANGSLGDPGEVHLYPLVIAEPATVDLSLVSSSFDALLELYRGAGAADLLATNLVDADDNGGGARNAALAALLRAGSYLVVVRDAAGTGTGPYGLQLKTEALPATRSTMAVLSGRLNDVDLNPLDPALPVESGGKISGSLRVSILNSNPSTSVFPLGATPTWGSPAQSFWQVDEWVTAGSSERSVAVDLTAPADPGTYYILLAAAPELTAADIMSGTHWESRAEELWEDGDDVAAWDGERIRHAVANGWVAVQWYRDYAADIAAAAVRVEVSAAASLPRGPVAIDFDPAPGDQGRRLAVTSGAGDRIQLQLVADDISQINGWSIALHYDPDQVAYVTGSFAAGDFIPGLIALVNPVAGALEVGGTVLGSDVTNSGDGLLGTLSFDVLPGFSFSTDLTIAQVTLRAPGQGRVKQEVLSRGVVSAPSGHPAGPVAIDLDAAAGDQGLRRLDSVRAGQRLEVSLFVTGAPDARGWSARIEYDQQVVRYVVGSFRPSDFIPGLVPLVGEKAGRLDVGGAVLGAASTAAGDGVLGSLAFDVTDAFADSALITITRVSFNTTASGEVIETVRNPAVLIAASAALPGDFTGDGFVDFSDFFRFADHFGLTRADANWDPLFDLDDTGEVDFSDFFRFADTFGTQRSKLMALAVEYLGLPWTVLVEQNAPNPFNTSTAIDYDVLRDSPVVLEIYDIAGQRVRTLVEGPRRPGRYRARWDGRDGGGAPVSSGVYLYRIAVPASAGLLGADLELPHKMLLLR